MVRVGGSQLATLALVQAAVLFLVRAAGPDLAGRYGAAVAVTSTLSFLLGCGTSGALIRRGAIDPEAIAPFTRRAVQLRLLACVPFAALVTSIAWLLGWAEGAVWLVACASLSALANSLQQIAKSNLEVRGRLTAFSVVGGLNAFFDAGIVALLITWLGGTLAAGVVLQGVLGTACAAAAVRRIAGRMATTDGRYPLSTVFRESLPYVFSGFFFNLAFRVDAIMIASTRTAAEVGYYTAASRVVMLGYLIPATVSIVLRRRLFALAARGPEAVAAVYRETCRFSAAVTLPASVALGVVGTALVPLLFGEAFRPGGAALAMLAPAVFLRAIAVPACDALTACGRQHLRTTLEGATVGLNALLNAFLLPLAGIEGVALATVCSEAALVVAARAVAVRYLGARFLLGLSMRPFGAAATAGIAMTGFRLMGMHAVVCLLVGALAYAAVALPFGVIGADDLRRLRAPEVSV